MTIKKKPRGFLDILPLECDWTHTESRCDIKQVPLVKDLGSEAFTPGKGIFTYSKGILTCLMQNLKVQSLTMETFHAIIALF